jgi:predicted lipoprotein with Yx(FWY)xxD motif
MRRLARMVVMLCAGTTGVALAVLVGVAVAKSFTLQVAKNATVTNFNTHKSRVEPIAVTAGGFAVYTLSGDSMSHPKCTKANGCFGFWPPVKLSSANKLSNAPGIKGKLGVWRRDGFIQLTLSGHPLYRFAPDGNRKGVATGQAINSFGGIWGVVSVATNSTGTSVMTSPTMSMTSPTTTTTTTTPTTTYPYPYGG